MTDNDKCQQCKWLLIIGLTTILRNASGFISRSFCAISSSIAYLSEVASHTHFSLKSVVAAQPSIAVRRPLISYAPPEPCLSMAADHLGFNSFVRYSARSTSSSSRGRTSLSVASITLTPTRLGRPGALVSLLFSAAFFRAPVLA